MVAQPLVSNYLFTTTALVYIFPICILACTLAQSRLYRSCIIIITPFFRDLLNCGVKGDRRIDFGTVSTANSDWPARTRISRQRKHDDKSRSVYRERGSKKHGFLSRIFSQVGESNMRRSQCRLQHSMHKQSCGGSLFKAPDVVEGGLNAAPADSRPTRDRGLPRRLHCTCGPRKNGVA
jgi:hypothetical protein